VHASGARRNDTAIGSLSGMLDRIAMPLKAVRIAAQGNDAGAGRSIRPQPQHVLARLRRSKRRTADLVIAARNWPYLRSAFHGRIVFSRPVPGIARAENNPILANDAGSDVIDHGRSAGELMRKPDREHLWPGVSRPKVLPHNPGWTTARIGQRRVKHIARAALVVAYRVARRERGG